MSRENFGWLHLLDPTAHQTANPDTWPYGDALSVFSHWRCLCKMCVEKRNEKPAAVVVGDGATI